MERYCECGAKLRKDSRHDVCYRCATGRARDPENHRVFEERTPPHIQDRIELYAARVAAGEMIFRGYERDLLVERGIREVA